MFNSVTVSVLQARETGICPVREELYAQCFDELIRQVTVNCAERGLLLLRVRDEMRMTIAAYQTLYESAVAFGIRKALQTEQGKSDLESRITTLESENKDLERQVGSGMTSRAMHAGTGADCAGSGSLANSANAPKSDAAWHAPCIDVSNARNDGAVSARHAAQGLPCYVQRAATHLGQSAESCK